MTKHTMDKQSWIICLLANAFMAAINTILVFTTDAVGFKFGFMVLAAAWCAAAAGMCGAILFEMKVRPRKPTVPRWLTQAFDDAGFTEVYAPWADAHFSRDGVDVEVFLRRDDRGVRLLFAIIPYHESGMKYWHSFVQDSDDVHRAIRDFKSQAPTLY